MFKNKIAWTLGLIALCVTGVLTFRTLRPNPEALLKQRYAQRSLGDPAAPLWITEYFDYQCPPCAAAYKIIEDAIQKHPGKIYLQVRYFPLPGHAHAMKAALHAECASRQKGKFWPFHGKLFDNQERWAKDPYAELQFLEFGQSVGLDLAKWDACIKDPQTQAFVTEEKEKASQLGVKITPSFFIDGKLVVGLEALRTELRKLDENKNTAAS